MAGLFCACPKAHGISPFARIPETSYNSTMGRGRTPKLTPEVQERFLEAVRGGATDKLAADLCGQSYDTVNEWLARGRGVSARKKTKLYAQFAQAVHKAHAVRNQELIRIARLSMGISQDPDKPLKPGEAISRRIIIAKPSKEDPGEFEPQAVTIIEEPAKWAAHYLAKYMPEVFGRPAVERMETKARILTPEDEDETQDAKNERHVIEISTALTRATFAFTEAEFELAADAETLGDIQRTLDRQEDAPGSSNGKPRKP